MKVESWLMIIVSLKKKDIGKIKLMDELINTTRGTQMMFLLKNIYL